MLHWTPLVPEQPNLSAVEWLLVPCRDQMASPRTDIYHTMSQLKSRDATSRDAQSLVEVSIIPFPSISTNSFLPPPGMCMGGDMVSASLWCFVQVVLLAHSTGHLLTHEVVHPILASVAHPALYWLNVAPLLHNYIFHCTTVQAPHSHKGMQWSGINMDKHPRHQPYLLRL